MTIMTQPSSTKFTWTSDLDLYNTLMFYPCPISDFGRYKSKFSLPSNIYICIHSEIWKQIQYGKCCIWSVSAPFAPILGWHLLFLLAHYWISLWIYMETHSLPVSETSIELDSYLPLCWEESPSEFLWELLKTVNRVGERLVIPISCGIP